MRAAEGGTVAYAGSELKGYGNLILIKHDDGYVSAYAHNRDLMVERGDSVRAGRSSPIPGEPETSTRLSFTSRSARVRPGSIRCRICAADPTPRSSARAGQP